MSTEPERSRGDAGREQENESVLAQGGQSGQIDPAEGADLTDGDLDAENPAAGERGDADLLAEGGQSQVDPAEGADFDE